MLALKQEHKKLFLRYANDETKKKFSPILKEESTQHIVSIEKMIVEKSRKELQLAPKKWYRIVTRKLDSLERVNQDIERQITSEIRHEIKDKKGIFSLVIFLVILSLLALVMLIVLFLRLYKVEQQQRTILEKYVIGSSTDLGGMITEVSQAFCQISGYSKKELIGQRLDFVCHPDTSRAMLEDMWAEISRGKSWQGKLKNQKKNGEPYWVYVHIEPLRDTVGKIRGYYAMRIKAQLGRCNTETALDHAEKIERLTRHMSKMIIEEHCNGTLSVQTEDGRTLFCIELPDRGTDEAV